MLPSRWPRFGRVPPELRLFASVGIAFTRTRPGLPCIGYSLSAFTFKESCLLVSPISACYSDPHRVTPASWDQACPHLPSRFWRHSTLDDRRDRLISGPIDAAKRGFKRGLWNRPHYPASRPEQLYPHGPSRTGTDGNGRERTLICVLYFAS